MTQHSPDSPKIWPDECTTKDCISIPSTEYLFERSPANTLVRGCYLAFLPQMLEDFLHYYEKDLTGNYDEFRIADEKENFLFGTFPVLFDSEGHLREEYLRFSKAVRNWVLDRLVVNPPHHFPKIHISAPEYDYGFFCLGDLVNPMTYEVNACAHCDGFIPIRRDPNSGLFYDMVKKATYEEDKRAYPDLVGDYQPNNFPEKCPYCRERLEVIRRSPKNGAVTYDLTRKEFDAQTTFDKLMQEAGDLIPVFYRNFPQWLYLYDGPDTMVFLRMFTYQTNHMVDPPAKAVGPFDLYFDGEGKLAE